MTGRKRQRFDLLKSFPPETVQDGIAAAEQIDPSPTQAHVGWIIRQWTAGVIRLPEDAADVRRLLERREEARARGALKGNDVNRHDYRELLRLVEDALARPSRRRQEMDAKRQGTRCLYEDCRYRILKVVTPQAAALYARNTRWCTSDPDEAADYLALGCLYIVFRDGQKLFQIHWPTRQVCDVMGRPATPDADLGRILQAVTGNSIAEGNWGRFRRLARLLRLPAEKNVPALRQAVLACYAAHDVGLLLRVLRGFQGMDLTEVNLDYLPDALIGLLWELFHMTPADRTEMGAGPPNNGGDGAIRCYQEFLAFYDELRDVHAGRPAQRTTIES